MTKTWSNVGLGASLSLLLLAGCARAAGGRNSSASRTDAGADPDASAEANEVVDGGASDDAGNAKANGGSRGREPATGGKSAGSLGGRGGQNQPDGSAAGSAASAADGGNAAPHGLDAAGAGGAGGVGGARGTKEDADAGSEPRDPDAICTSCGACEETQKIVSTMHTDMPVNYPDPPPTSGPHNPCWGTWGVHDEPLAPERWVHNLEHGGVVFLYNCPDGCADDVATLTDIAKAHPRTVLTAYDKLPARFALVAWGHRLVSDCLDEQAFSAFYQAHFDQGPESIASQPNPSCPP